MTVALLVVTDGRRHCLERMVSSFFTAYCPAPSGPVVVVDDSGDPEHRAWLRTTFDAEFVFHPERRGFAAAIDSGWRAVQRIAPDWVFHLEEDFVFERPFSVESMQEVLTARPHLIQMALKRQPCNAREAEAGGLVQAHPGQFTPCSARRPGAEFAGLDVTWMEHRLWFTTNPSLYRGDLVKRGWPQTPESEGRFTHGLLDFGHLGVPADKIRFGLWGEADDEPWVTHIGERTGTGY